MEAEVEAVDHGSDNESSSEDSSMPLPADNALGSDSLLSLGRDIIGLVARHLDASDRFSLMLTCKKIAERLLLLRLTAPCEERWRCRHACKADRKRWQNLAELARDMFRVPPPSPPETLPGEGLTAVVCTSSFVSRGTERILCRTLRQRGYRVELNEFLPVMYREFTAKRLCARLKGKLLPRHTKHGAIRLGGGQLDDEMAAHFQFICEQKGDLIVDLCKATGHVLTLRRMLALQGCPRYWNCFWDSKKALSTFDRVYERLASAQTGTAFDYCGNLAVCSEFECRFLFNAAKLRRKVIVLRQDCFRIRGPSMMKKLRVFTKVFAHDHEWMSAFLRTCSGQPWILSDGARAAVWESLHTWMSFCSDFGLVERKLPEASADQRSKEKGARKLYIPFRK